MRQLKDTAHPRERGFIHLMELNGRPPGLENNKRGVSDLNDWDELRRFVLKEKKLSLRKNRRH